MKIIEQLEKLSDLGKSGDNKQNDLTVSEVFYLWNQLVLRYESLETTNLLASFAKDEDLKKVLDNGVNVLNQQIKILEQIFYEYKIPFPERNRKDANKSEIVEFINDKYIYRQVRKGIRTMIPYHLAGFLHSPSSKIKGLFREFLLKEIDMYDKMDEYGKLKSYTLQPPLYKNGG